VEDTETGELIEGTDRTHNLLLTLKTTLFQKSQDNAKRERGWSYAYFGTDGEVLLQRNCLL
jgi:hypothetical protein